MDEVIVPVVVVPVPVVVVVPVVTPAPARASAAIVGEADIRAPARAATPRSAALASLRIFMGPRG